MVHQVTLEEAALNLRELVQMIDLGQEVVLLLDQKPVARIVSPTVIASPPDFSEWKAALRRIRVERSVGELPLEATSREAIYGDDLR